MIEIRMATQADVSAICELWHTAFPKDSKEGCRTFLNAISLHKDCVVACENSTPISMAFFIPAVLRIENQEFSVRYLYAAATLPSYRNQGVFSKLLRWSHQLWQKQGIAACFLNPAEPSLVDFYQRFGYQPVAFCRTIEGTAGSESLNITPVSVSEYQEIRAALLPPESIVWRDSIMQYAASYGTPVRIGHTACAFCESNGRHLRIVDMLGIPQTSQIAACQALATWFECDTFTARFHTQDGACYGMLVPLDTDQLPPTITPYIGLVFD